MNQRFFSNLGIFASFMMMTAVSIYLWSPAKHSSAFDWSTTAGSTAYTASLSGNSAVAINAIPNGSQQTFTADDTLNFSSTCPYSASVKLNMSSTSGNLTRTGSDSGVKTIASTTGSSLANNSWGYSINSGTSYYAVPLSNATPANIYTSSGVISNKSINVKYGIKLDNTIPSGEYSSTVVYSLLANESCIKYTLSFNTDGGSAISDVMLTYGQTINLSNYTTTKNGFVFDGWELVGTSTVYNGDETNVNVNSGNALTVTLKAKWISPDPMQSFDCTELSIGDVVKLKDTRDGNVYTVKKLADGRCWMTENLRIVNKGISSADSNLPSGETYTIPASDISSFTTSYNTNSAYLDAYGGYYNFYTATAGWGTNIDTVGNSPKDICPKGWRLPTGDPSGEFQTFYDSYNSVALMRDDAGFNLDGFVRSGAVRSRGSIDSFWSSTAYEYTSAYQYNNAYYMNASDSSASPAAYGTKYIGRAVRCIAKEPTMQTYDTTKLKNVGDSIELLDERDGNKYTVKKLADGKVWMIGNLKIIDKTIDSTDSNLPAGMTYTIPASNISPFSQDFTNAAYIDSSYGGYYNFYTATARSYTGNGTNNDYIDASMDICPKGWHIPTKNEAETLYEKYNTYASMTGEPNFTLGGRIIDTGLDRVGQVGDYWTSTYRRTMSIALEINANYSFIDISGNVLGEDEGGQIRCVSYETMQNYDASRLRNAGDSERVIDRRDGNIYTAKKLADGNVWMTENLRLVNKTISSADSNLPSGVTWTVPASSATGFSAANNNDVYLDSTYGGYYSFYAATAGWGTDSVTSGDSPQDICPKGWRLPTGGYGKEFKALNDEYDTYELLIGDPGFVTGGIRLNNSSGYSDYGFYWSSSVHSSDNAFNFAFNNNSAIYSEGGSTKVRGFSVRCMIKVPSMQTYDTSKLVNVNDSIDLVDERDGNVYTVKKLEDGNVWMTENLRLGKSTAITLTPDDSDVSSNYQLPAKITTLSSEDFKFGEWDTSNTYIDNTYGGYYTFHAATAGTGGSSFTSGDAPSSICPKGWKLPNDNDMINLYRKYHSSALMQGSPGFVNNGYIYNGVINGQGSKGYYQTSSVASNGVSYMYALRLEGSIVSTTYTINKNYGASIHCLAR